MARDVLDQPVKPVQERIREIENTPIAANLGELLDRAAVEKPDTLAWNFFESGETITYKDLGHRSEMLAKGFFRHGVKRDSHVILMMPTIGAFPLTWLALGRLGAVVIPTNAGYTAREVAYVANDGDAEFALVHTECLPVLEEARASGAYKIADDHIFVIGAGDHRYRRWESLEADGVSGPAYPRDVDRTRLFNIQYTSGTTGFPKGCMLTQTYWLTTGLVNGYRDGRQYDRIFVAGPFHYMNAPSFLMMALTRRATLFVAVRRSLSKMMAWMRDNRIQFAQIPVLIDKEPPHPLDGQNEIVRANLYRVWGPRHAEFEERFNLVGRDAFGMTEVGSATFLPLEAVDMVGSGSCGIAAPYRQIRIADPEGNELPAGESGELLIRGQGILLGYYKKPEVNQRSFHGDWFRSGDVAYKDARGYIFVVGRIKDMIRRSGENIAAQEVEAVLNTHEAVLESAVIPVPDELRGEEVKACLVLQPGVAASDGLIEDILAHARKDLAAFKLPRFVEIYGEFPKTSSGKTAKQTLIEAKNPWGVTIGWRGEGEAIGVVEVELKNTI